MRDTVSNLANLVMGQVGKNIAANQKKIKNRLAKALPAGESPPEASGPEGESKPKRRSLALQNPTAKQKVTSASPTSDIGAQAAATHEVPQAAPFHLVLLMVSEQGQAKEAKMPSDVSSTPTSSDGGSIQAVTASSNPVGKLLGDVQTQTAPAAKISKAETTNRAEVLTADSEQTKPTQIAKDSVPQQAPQQTIQQVPDEVLQAEMPQQAQVQLKPAVDVVDATAAQAKPVASETPALWAKAVTNVSEVQQAPQASGQRVQQGKAQVQPEATNSTATPQGVPSVVVPTAVVEAPSVKSSVVASSGAPKQAAMSVLPSAGVVSGNAFHAVAAQVLANTDAAQVSAAPSAAVAATGSHAMDSSVAGQIARAVASVGPGGLGHQMVIQLNPPELGRVHLTLESRGDQIRGVLRVDDPGTLTQLRQESPSLVHRLSENGLDVRQMDIVPSHQGADQSQAFGQGQDGQAARQQQSSPWRDASPSGSSQATFNQTTPLEDVQYVGTGSINTLA